MKNLVHPHPQRRLASDCPRLVKTQEAIELLQLNRYGYLIKVPLKIHLRSRVMR